MKAPKHRYKTLVVDDHANILNTIQIMLEDQIDFTGVSDPERALDLIQTNSYDIVISDYDLKSDITGIVLLKEARKRNPLITSCLMSANDAAPVMRDMFQVFGGIFVEKPFNEDSFSTVLEQAKRNEAQLKELTGGSSDIDPIFNGIIAETPSMVKLLDTIKTAAKMQSLALHMAGSTGTGKTVLAELVHKLSGVKGPFVKVNCAGLAELAMGQLFGYAKGAFTGAVNEHDGYIKQANGGTLFLDELHLLPKEVQGHLLHVIQSGEYTRLGDKLVRESHFRLITAASVSVKNLAESEEFMRDLWYRVSGKTLTVPSLAERRACIPRLIYQFLKTVSLETGQSYEIEAQAMDLLVSFSWDGNIRDLENSIKALCSDSGSTGKITADLVRVDLSNRAGRSFDEIVTLTRGENLESACKGFEVSLISKALRHHNNNISLAARTLGVPRSTLRGRIETLGMQVKYYRSSSTMNSSSC